MNRRLCFSLSSPFSRCCTAAGAGGDRALQPFLPNLFSWVRGSIICFDTKGDLYATAGPRRAAMGQRILRLAPFDGGTDSFNPLSTIPRDSPLLVDSARAMAEALVTRSPHEADPHWSEKSVQVITALLVLILLRVKDEERNLNTVQDIVSDPELVKSAALRLRKIGGIPARLGNQLMALFEKNGGGLTKEGTGVLSSVSRYLAFLDSELIARSLATSSFAPQELQKPGITLFIQLPTSQLEAQRGWLRLKSGSSYHLMRQARIGDIPRCNTITSPSLCVRISSGRRNARLPWE